MSDSRPDDLTGGDWTPAGFVRLRRRGPDTATQAGCAFALAALLLVIGGGILAAYIINPAGKGDMWVMPVVGGVFALVGMVLLYGGIRGARGAGITSIQLYLQGRAQLAPGTTTHLRLRQPGPINIESLKVKLVCERTYQRKVRENSSATVEDQEQLYENVVFEIKDKRLGKGEALEQELEVTMPTDVPLTGPAQPDGTIRWTVEVWGEAGFMRATYHPFEITVKAVST